MKGLLHRLAARAAGTAVAVRSDARLAYGAERRLWSEERSAAPERAHEEPVPFAAPAVDVSRRRPAACEAPGMPMGLALLESAPRIAVRAGMLSSGPPRRKQPATAGDPRESAAERGIDAAAADGGIEASRSLRLPPSRPAAESREGQPRPRELGDAPWSQGSQPAPRVVSRDPSPLLPATPRDAATGDSPARRAAPQHPQPDPPFAVDLSGRNDTTEVHIHIGRIEVTAVQEASKVRRKPAARPPALSLDAYLASRSRV